VDAFRRLDPDKKGVTQTYTLGGKQRAAVVYESDLYALILSSSKEEAKALRKHVDAPGGG
jgi:prophage antirepressor-like protein